MTTTPLAWSNLAGTMRWQLDHIQASFAGHAIDDIPCITPSRVIRVADTAPVPAGTVMRPPSVSIEDWARWNRPEMRDCILSALNALKVPSRTQAIADKARRSLSATKSILYAGAAVGHITKTMVGRFAEWELADTTSMPSEVRQ